MGKRLLPPATTGEMNPAAAEIGRRGGPKGGKARAAKMTPEGRSGPADMEAGEQSGYYREQVGKFAGMLAGDVVREAYEVSIQA